MIVNGALLGRGRVGKALMSYTSETPFDNIDSSKEYVSMLAEAIEEAIRDVDQEVAGSLNDGAERRKEALQIVAYNLAKLSFHIKTSRRILNDLRTLRRLLLAEREPLETRVKAASTKA